MHASHLLVFCIPWQQYLALLLSVRDVPMLDLGLGAKVMVSYD
jgi:hypothetical protein